MAISSIPSDIFRKAEETDIERIWQIIGQAKAQMQRLEVNNGTRTTLQSNISVKTYKTETDTSFAGKTGLLHTESFHSTVNLSIKI